MMIHFDCSEISQTVRRLIVKYNFVFCFVLFNLIDIIRYNLTFSKMHIINPRNDKNLKEKKKLAKITCQILYVKLSIVSVLSKCVITMHKLFSLY